MAENKNSYSKRNHNDIKKKKSVRIRHSHLLKISEQRPKALLSTALEELLDTFFRGGGFTKKIEIAKGETISLVDLTALIGNWVEPSGALEALFAWLDGNPKAQEIAEKKVMINDDYIRYYNKLARAINDTPDAQMIMDESKRALREIAKNYHFEKLRHLHLYLVLSGTYDAGIFDEAAKSEIVSAINLCFKMEYRAVMYMVMQSPHIKFAIAYHMRKNLFREKCERRDYEITFRDSVAAMNTLWPDE